MRKKGDSGDTGNQSDKKQDGPIRYPGYIAKKPNSSSDRSQEHIKCVKIHHRSKPKEEDTDEKSRKKRVKLIGRRKK